jgi:hypothetical protein
LGFLKTEKALRLPRKPLPEGVRLAASFPNDRVYVLE